ncbi:hypothetical protein GQ53DRAFT_702217 [Thozetella sp. PMI_491]|nr:hypothetical protein GQ53DRAFT_702217 [Thozetella sp. PMI_491]
MDVEANPCGPPSYSHELQLPPREEIVDACRVFINCCFQLHFIPKVRFLAQAEGDLDSINQFLLMCILSMSARFTPSLIKRFGGPAEASDFFVQRAEEMVLLEMYKPTLETAQGLIFLGASEWAKGDCNKSLIHLGVSSTIVGMLRLYREDTYILSEDAQPEDIIYSESARRTLWMMGMLRNLFAGLHSPIPFDLADLTTLLPCDENEYAFGIVPKVRAALPTSQAAIDRPELVNCSSRSLFATLIQAFKFWGQVARGACVDAAKSKNASINLWDNASQYSQLSMALMEWEASISKQHMWSEWNLRVYKAQNLDIAYTSIFLGVRLSNIVLRRTYLEEMKAGILGEETPLLFLENMAQELFTNGLSLYEGIVVYLANRPLAEGFPSLLAFGVYLCGSLAMHLWRCPQLCPQVALRAESILHWSKRILLEMCSAWPIAAHWQRVLEDASASLPPPSNERMSDSSQIGTEYPTLNVPMTTQSGPRAPQPTLAAQFSFGDIPSSADPLGLMFDSYNYSENVLLGHGAEFQMSQAPWG